MARITSAITATSRRASTHREVAYTHREPILGLAGSAVLVKSPRVTEHSQLHPALGLRLLGETWLAGVGAGQASFP